MNEPEVISEVVWESEPGAAEAIRKVIKGEGQENAGKAKPPKGAG